MSLHKRQLTDPSHPASDSIRKWERNYKKTIKKVAPANRNNRGKQALEVLEFIFYALFYGVLGLSEGRLHRKKLKAKRKRKKSRRKRGRPRKKGRPTNKTRNRRKREAEKKSNLGKYKKLF